MSQRKDTLIYQSAAEAVLQARIEIQRMLANELHYREKIDDILSKAMMNAGEWAVRAYHADTRTCKDFRQVVGK